MEVLFEIIFEIIGNIVIEGALAFAYWFVFKSKVPGMIKAILFLLINGGILWISYKLCVQYFASEGIGEVVIIVLVTLLILGVMNWSIISTYIRVNKLRKYGQEDVIGKEFKMIIEHHRGEAIYGYPGQKYELCMGYIEGKYDKQGNKQKAYLLLDTKEDVNGVKAVVVAIIHRNNGENLWVLNASTTDIGDKKIREKVDFLEQYYDSEVLM